MKLFREPPESNDIVRIGFENVNEATHYLRKLGAYAHQKAEEAGVDDRSGELSRRQCIAALHLQAQIIGSIVEHAPGKNPFEAAPFEVEIDNPETGDAANRAMLIAPYELTAIQEPQPVSWNGLQHPSPTHI